MIHSHSWKPRPKDAQTPSSLIQIILRYRFGGLSPLPTNPNASNSKKFHSNNPSSFQENHNTILSIHFFLWRNPIHHRRSLVKFHLFSPWESTFWNFWGLVLEDHKGHEESLKDALFELLRRKERSLSSDLSEGQRLRWKWGDFEKFLFCKWLPRIDYSFIFFEVSEATNQKLI